MQKETFKHFLKKLTEGAQSLYVERLSQFYLEMIKVEEKSLEKIDFILPTFNKYQN